MLSVFACFGHASLDVHFEDHAAGFWGRYVVTQGNVRKPGWITSDGTAQWKTITGISAGSSSTFRAIFYAPGCALQIADMPIGEDRPYQYFFACQELPQIYIQGVLLRRYPRLRDSSTNIEAKYVATWAADFFGYDDGTTTEIPLAGEAGGDRPNAFRLRVPDFSKDAIASSWLRVGEIRIWVRDRDSGRIVDQLRVSPDAPNNERTRFGGIPVSALNAAPMVFTLCSAGWTGPHDHDQYGFASRTEEPDGCGLP